MTRMPSMRAAVVFCTALAAGCATHRAPENPDAIACTPPETKALYSRDYNERLAAHTVRADAFSQCMTARGYVFDDKALSERMLHFEQVQNSRWLGGDPWWAMQIYRQEQRMAPELWHTAGEKAKSPP